MKVISAQEIEQVSGGITPTEGGLAMVGMALIPGVNVGLAAFALTVGLGFIIGSAYYGGGGGGGGTGGSGPDQSISSKVVRIS
jgi:hypothetical protein